MFWKNIVAGYAKSLKKKRRCSHHSGEGSRARENPSFPSESLSENISVRKIQQKKTEKMFPPTRFRVLSHSILPHVGWYQKLRGLENERFIFPGWKQRLEFKIKGGNLYLKVGF